MSRRIGLFLAVAFVLPLVVAASASAQGSILILNPSSARPGEVVTATSFGGYSTGNGISDVSLRLSSRSGQLLRTTTPDTSASINTSFPVPAGLTPGTYLILATQTTTANGRQRAFTPGRAKLVVPAAAASRGQGGLAGRGTSLTLWAVTLSLILLLAVGSTLTARRLRTSNRPRLGS